MTPYTLQGLILLTQILISYALQDVDSLKESVLECVKDGDPMVVLVTIEAIPALFSRGNRMAIMALVRCLRHESSSVREAATRVLGEFAENGDLRAIGYIVPLIDHHMAYVC